jgi:predicted regulator of Ras-like GTPase activity (Roadblock/LC7/MglB family)
MTSRLGVVLESAMKAPGVMASVLVDPDGSVIETASNVEGDLAVSSALAWQMRRMWTSVGTDLGMGAVDSMLLEWKGGSATITPMGQNATLLMFANRACRPGRLRREARRGRERMDEGTPVGPPAEVTPPPTDHLDGDIVRAVDEAGPARNPIAGEVVLIGAHTFRLVTRLIAQLLQTKGVQSSRLRAYSPSSTIIDVVLEDGATLAAVDHGDLDELALERTEEGGTRLIFRAGTALGTSPIGSRG